MGDSKKRLKEFPSETQRAMGGALMLAQLGGLADHAKPAIPGLFCSSK